MKFGLYIHIPYCLQRCIYCDFATYEKHQILPPDDYIQLLKKEIFLKSQSLGPRLADTVYFGGGTPSLLSTKQLSKIISALKENGFSFNSDSEVTIEINPATLTEATLNELLKIGFNRFSVGAQTFNDSLLTQLNRKHSSQDTRDTLGLLQKYKLNYSLDLLFALPNQSLEDLRRDLEIIVDYNPPHVSPYCLTVPESNPLSKNRPHEENQIAMFDVIKIALVKSGLHQYEISNFAKPSFESRHNLLYWEDDEYLGLGLSAHSYIKKSPYGIRFWNTRNIKNYEEQLSSSKLNQEQEVLELHQSLTDYFHTSLRTQKGLNKLHFEAKYKNPPEYWAKKQIDNMTKAGWLIDSPTFLRLTEAGILVSNRVFEEFTFLTNRGSETIFKTGITY